MKELSTSEAKQALGNINATQRQVKAQGPKEYVPFIGWGLFVLLGYPPFDFLNGNIWGPIISVVWIVGMILTFRYFRDKSARVHIFTSTPWFVWVALVAATSLAVALAEGFHSKYHYAWTISGVLLSLFYIGYGLKVKAEAR